MVKFTKVSITYRGLTGIYMEGTSKKHVPISWWIFRDLEGTALRVTDEQPMPETIQAPNGVWTLKVVRPAPDRYEILERTTEVVRSNTPDEVNVIWDTVGTIHAITKAEYETCLEFGLFDG